MEINEIRNLFPHLKTEQIYFNHAALGPWSKPLLERLELYARQRSGEKIENFKFFLRWNASAKSKLARLLNTKSGRIAWTDNVSNSLNILAQGLSWKTGDQIIINDLEFPSNVYPFLNLKKHGVEITIVKNRNGTVDLEDIEKAITTRTKLISISSVQFLTGYRANIEEIGKLCRNKGITFCVDAIQGVGVINTDVEKYNVDFLTGGTQKWLMSMEGLAYFYITEELQEKIDQKFVGWTSVEDAWNLLDYNLILKKDADRFQNGTMNTLGVALFDAMLDIFTKYGIGNIEKRILENTNYFIEQLSESGFEPVLKNTPESNRAGIVTIPVDNPEIIFEELERHEIHCSLRQGLIRFSPHFYNTKDEIDRTIDILKKSAGKNI
ncbi:aminotransferase [Melioribacter roseus P3M-2]|uniref:Aminotransferase n=1 Tax=Melioribacter roseus (strain DSM 23840 / JCM 17771 / VKM B-2668 / P3M-2) TaxID=1191523 RepID=I6Z686_MELRP|nr:aminotransferase class V-fold PLP-dependent enzyme [Melioribacter roseus]AFN74675.1 aminotransferase [Melioribacter roseus P3M-2]